MTQPVPNIRDLGVSIIRTWVPVLWGGLLTWAVSQVPALEPVLNEHGMVALGGVIAMTITGLWYAFFRSIESKLPAWLTVLVLGSNQPPVYQQPAVVPGTINFTRDARDEPLG